MSESARLESVYELDATTAWVRGGGYSRVALQMPDELLGDATAVAAALERRCNDALDRAEGAPVRVFVLADTTFGSCCVDEVAAAHHNADCIVHFGRACMSPVARLPARFVFHKVEIDTDTCAAAIRAHAAALARPEATPDDDRRVEALVVLVDQEHAHRAAALREAVARETTDRDAGAGPPVVFADAAPVEALPRARAFSKAPRARRCGGGCSCASESACGRPELSCGDDAGDGTCATCGEPRPSDQDPSAATERDGDETYDFRGKTSSSSNDDESSSVRVGGHFFSLPSGRRSEPFLSRCAFVWVGRGESPSLTQALSVLHGRCRGVAQFDPESGDLALEAAGSGVVARVVKRRRFLIEKARESRVVGIVAGTLGVAGYLAAIAELRALIKRSGRKSYTVVAGKPNPQKLANFPEIETFVLVSCEHAALVDGRDYLQPVITPWEAQVAFTHGAHWDGEVRLDFDHLLEPRGGASALGALARREEGRREETPEFSFLGGGVRAGPRRRVPGEPRDEDEASSSEGEEEGDENEGVLGDGSVRVKSKAATALATRASAAVAARAGGSGIADVRSGAEYLLSRRTYTGLEPGPRRDEDGAAADAPLEAAKGLSGRARSYKSENAKT